MGGSDSHESLIHGIRGDESDLLKLMREGERFFADTNVAGTMSHITADEATVCFVILISG